ncbi:MAG: bleomycin resistance protein [Gemmatimonadaceae bacterium]
MTAPSPHTRSTLRAVQPVLPVHDIATALAFYTERLGFRFLFGDRTGAPAYAGVGRDGIELHLQWQAAEAFADGSAALGNLRFVVDDPDALLAEFRASGVVRSEVAVRDTAWGTREFGFRDPNGNGLTFYRDR